MYEPKILKSKIGVARYTFEALRADSNANFVVQSVAELKWFLCFDISAMCSNLPVTVKVHIPTAVVVSCGCTCLKGCVFDTRLRSSFQHMGMRSQLTVDIPPKCDSSIRVACTARLM